MKSFTLLSSMVFLVAILVTSASAKDKKFDWEKFNKEQQVVKKYEETVLNPALERFKEKLLRKYRLYENPMFEDVEITGPDWITLWVKAEDLPYFDPAFVSWAELKGLLLTFTCG